MTGIGNSKGHVVIVGCGAIGSVLVDQVARMPEVNRLTLIDPDTYSCENLQTQCITRFDIGRPKVTAQRRHVRSIRPDLDVAVHQARVEELPVGALRGSVICACVDSRRTRVDINEIAWRLGIPWIDSGVLASQMLARVEKFVPGHDQTCLECSFGDQHYETMEFRHPCQKPGDFKTPATGAPSYLGSIAASLQAAECRLLLLGDFESGLKPGEQLLYGTRTHLALISRNRRNPDCRFDHGVYHPDTVAGGSTLRRLLGEIGVQHCSAYMHAPGLRFIQGSACKACGRTDERFQVLLRGASPVRQCRNCAAQETVSPAMLRDRISLRTLSAPLLSKSLTALGLRPLELFCVGDGLVERWFILGASARTAGNKE